MHEQLRYSTEMKKYEDNPMQFIKDHRIAFHSQTQKQSVLPILEFEEVYINLIHNNKLSITNKSRQMHLSSLTAAYCAWKIIFSSHYNILVFSCNQESSNRFIEKVRTILKSYSSPVFNWEEDYAINNKSEIRLSNGCFIKGCPSTPDAGKGYMIDMAIFDEAAFIKKIDLMYKSVGLAMSQKEDSKIVFVSTPHYKKDLFHTLWTNSKNKLKLHWSQNPYYNKELETRTDDDGNEYLWSPWYSDRCKMLNNDKKLISFEYNNEFIDKPEKDQRINIRLKGNLYKQIEEKFEGDELNISLYIRDLIKKDLES